MDRTITLTSATTGAAALSDAAGRRLRRMATRLWVRARVRAAGVRIGDPATAALATVILVSAYFLLFPGVDPMVSTLFHGPAGFALAEDPVLKALRKSSTLGLVATLVVILVILVQRATRTARIGRARVRLCLFLLAGLAIGPGLVVNALLKQTWGRARPIQTDLFGGEADFIGVWAISDGCRSNCSFVSGEASSSMWMVCALILLAPAGWRPWVIGPAATYGFALSMNRIAFGGHYLSDVLLSWAITGLVLAVLHRLMVARPEPGRRPVRISRMPVAA